MFFGVFSTSEKTKERKHNPPKVKSLVMTEPGLELSSVCYQERDGEAVEADPLSATGQEPENPE